MAAIVVTDLSLFSAYILAFSKKLLDLFIIAGAATTTLLVEPPLFETYSTL